MRKNGSSKTLENVGEEKKVYQNYLTEFSKNREGPIKKVDPHETSLHLVMIKTSTLFKHYLDK